MAEGLPGRRSAQASAPEGDRAAAAVGRGTSEAGTWYRAIREAREPFAGEVLIDVHSHTGYGAPYFIAGNGPNEIAHQVRRHGFSKLVTFAFSGPIADWTWGNDFACRAVQEHPDLILPLASANLWHACEMEQEMARCCDELGFWGVKMHPWWNDYPGTQPNTERACAFCHEHGLTVTNHHWGPPQVLER